MMNGNSAVNTIAPIGNVALFHSLVEEVINRAPGLPGMGAFTGYSGLGKTFSATYAANTFEAYYVEAKFSWTQRAFVKAVLLEMGIEPAKTVWECVEQIAQQLALSNRPLIVDEMDHLLRRGIVELVRDIYESSQATIILIGEEHLAGKLKVWERFHGRVLKWVRADYATLEDAQHLAALYCDKDLRVEEPLLQKITEVSTGSARRICVNLAQVNEAAKVEGWKEATLERWGKRGWFTGAPAPRGGRA